MKDERKRILISEKLFSGTHYTTVSILDFQNLLKKAISKIPKDLLPKAYIEILIEENYDSFDFCMSYNYKRLETQKEYKNRIKDEKEVESKKYKEEMKEYLRLKKKFEDK